MIVAYLGTLVPLVIASSQDEMLFTLRQPEAVTLSRVAPNLIWVKVPSHHPNVATSFISGTIFIYVQVFSSTKLYLFRL